MTGEIIVLSKQDVIEMLEGYNRRTQLVLEKIEKMVARKANDASSVPVRRIFAKEIKKIMGISQATFERNLDKLPLHKTKSGRHFCYEHDLTVFLFKEHPPYADYEKFSETINTQQLIKSLSGDTGL